MYENIYVCESVGGRIDGERLENREKEMERQKDRVRNRLIDGEETSQGYICNV